MGGHGLFVPRHGHDLRDGLAPLGDVELLPRLYPHEVFAQGGLQLRDRGIFMDRILLELYD